MVKIKRSPTATDSEHSEESSAREKKKPVTIEGLPRPLRRRPACRYFYGRPVWPAALTVWHYHKQLRSRFPPDQFGATAWRRY